jgi:ABC-type uncharacterized transport system permease subunit
MTIVLIAVLAYLAAAALLVRAVARGSRPGASWLLPALAGVVLHAAWHLREWQAAGVADLHFFAALSLVGLGMAALTASYAAGGRMAALGVIVFPIAAAMLAADAAVAYQPSPAMAWPLQLHAWTALLAYATLAIAALLALLLWMQERALRRRALQPWMRALPPLVELESLLFRSIGAGFVLLSATLLTGVVFVEDMLAQHLAHKTVFSVLSWLAFGALLAGRWRLGWRGTVAVGWTLAAMALLGLAFFGSKFVLELVLDRA